MVAGRTNRETVGKYHRDSLVGGGDVGDIKTGDVGERRRGSVVGRREVGAEVGGGDAGV